MPQKTQSTVHHTPVSWEPTSELAEAIEKFISTARNPTVDASVTLMS